MKDSLHLIIDGGGTKIAGILFHGDGTIVRSARKNENANICLSGGSLDALAEKIVSLIHTICNDDEYERLYSVTSTIANYDKRILPILEQKLVGKRLFVCGDLYPAHLSCFGNGNGICALSGTGSFACYRRASEVSLFVDDYAIVGGWGSLDDDKGSGYYAGVSALRLLFREFDCNNFSALGKNIGVTLGLPLPFNRRDLEKILYSTLTRRDIAQLSVVVANLAKQGEENALHILDDTALQLAKFCQVIYENEVKSGNCPVSAVGGLIKAGEVIIEPFKKHLNALNPRLTYAPPLFQNYVGSILVALLSTGVEITDEIIDNLKKTAHLAD